MSGTLLLFKKGKTGKTGLALRKNLNCYSTRGLNNGQVPLSWVSRVIRWGSSEMPELESLPSLNSLGAVSLASNKLASLKALNKAGVSVPWFTSNKESGKDFLERHRKNIVGRTTYHQGGSSFMISPDWYSLYYDDCSSHWLELIPIHNEWRVHVFRGEVIGVSRKTNEEVEWRITNNYTRNHHSGWRFVRCDLDQVQPNLKDIAIRAVASLGLDFGAVDVILSDGTETTSDGRRKYYVLEVNTACGMEENSSIFNAYLDKFKEWEYGN
jgi:glutathione synthase/RimK-type ligase-like ATP-grasp enzyme